jgi:hypothetical protein
MRRIPFKIETAVKTDKGCQQFMAESLFSKGKGNRSAVGTEEILRVFN